MNRCYKKEDIRSAVEWAIKMIEERKKEMEKKYIKSAYLTRAYHYDVAIRIIKEAFKDIMKEEKK